MAGLFEDLVPSSSFDELVPDAASEDEPDTLAADSQGVLTSLANAFMSVMDTVNASGQGQAAAIPFSDEIMAGASAPFVASVEAMNDDSGAEKSVPERLGEAYESELERLRDMRAEAEEKAPVAYGAGQAAGAAGLVPARAGHGVGLLNQMVRGGAVGGTYGAVHGFGEGEGIDERLEGARDQGLTGLAVGTAAPPVVTGGAAAVRGLTSLAQKPISAVRGMISPDAEAARRVASAQARDAGAGLTESEFRAAQFVGQPVTNLERGGESVRALARSAANTSPEARAALDRAIDDRFESQGARISGFIRELVGRTNAVATRESLKAAARKMNRPAYRNAYRLGDGGIWTDELQRLSGAPAVQKAMRAVAQGRGRDRAIADGFGDFNPRVTVDDAGRLRFAPDKGGAYPNLQYWDYVKRELDDAASSAFRLGHTDAGSVLSGLARSLRSELDSVVPAYGKARSTAARFFEAEDALEAGENFTRMNIDHARARHAIAKMSPPERRLFREGFVSSLTDQISKTGDRRNVVNTLYGSQKAREKFEIALGKTKAREMEAFLRTESLMDLARGAVQGNSTSVRQLVEMGLAGGVSGYSTGDPTNAIVGALMWGAGRKAVNKIDEKVARRVGEMLASDDPGVFRRGVRRVAKDIRLMGALRAASGAMGAAASQQAEAIAPY